MLKYVGDGSWLSGIPARDLTDEEVEIYGGEAFLTRSGLYRRPERKMERPVREDKMERPIREDKE